MDHALTRSYLFLYGHKAAMKPGMRSFPATWLLDQLRQRIRRPHYSLQTEEHRLHQVRFYPLARTCCASGGRQPLHPLRGHRLQRLCAYPRGRQLVHRHQHKRPLLHARVWHGEGR